MWSLNVFEYLRLDRICVILFFRNLPRSCQGLLISMEENPAFPFLGIQEIDYLCFSKCNLYDGVSREFSDPTFSRLL